MPQTLITITDLTRMSGRRVCIAGVTEDLHPIRPEFDYGVINEDWLFDQDGNVVIRPFASVYLDLLRNAPQPPHTEDWLVRPDVKRFAGLLDMDKRKDLLQKIVDPDVISIFNADIYHDQGYYVRENEGSRSLGTVEAHITDVSHRSYDGRWDYRISFIDNDGEEYRLSVTDLAFRAYVDHLREVQGQNPEMIGYPIEQELRNSTVYLRIGLARAWSKRPHCCFLQVNGIYSFPDYLEGRCFADFKQ